MCKKVSSKFCHNDFYQNKKTEEVPSHLNSKTVPFAIAKLEVPKAQV